MNQKNRRTFHKNSNSTRVIISDSHRRAVLDAFHLHGVTSRTSLYEMVFGSTEGKSIHAITMTIGRIINGMEASQKGSINSRPNGDLHRQWHDMNPGFPEKPKRGHKSYKA
jgi:hypothetical protein